ncbi:MAG TPA: hypothetical protein PLH57_04850 [Oligoflexia bacterium]|nr:hypothetical protein [Oligoflexia bacterium]
MTQTQAPDHLLLRANAFFGIAGLFFFFQFGDMISVKSFLVGWAIAVVNLELLRRIMKILIAYYNGQKPSKLIYFLVFAKLSFWGVVIAAFSKLDWIHPLPFVIGTLTILVAGFAFGFREFFRDKTATLRVGQQE